MIRVSEEHLKRLVEIESTVHYNESPPGDHPPITVKVRKSNVLLSAPHGACTFRNNDKEKWHAEDEYTAGMALLLGELCGVSVIATVWHISDHDPNFHTASNLLYKKELRNLVENQENKQGVEWIIDLHGAGFESQHLAETQLVDLGTGRSGKRTFPVDQYNYVKDVIEKHIGIGSTDRKGKRGFPASKTNQSITNFSYTSLKKNAIQLEMKPQLRVVKRLPTASLYSIDGEFEAKPSDIINMLQALIDIIEELKSI